MKEFLKALLYALVAQFFCWTAFILFDEFPFIRQKDAEFLALVAGLACSIIVLVLYFTFTKEIVAKNKLNPAKFNIFLILSWILLSLLSTLFLTKLVDRRLLHRCNPSDSLMGCFLNGFEYYEYGAILIAVSAIIIAQKALSSICKSTKKKGAH